VVISHANQSSSPRSSFSEATLSKLASTYGSLVVFRNGLDFGSGSLGPSGRTGYPTLAFAAVCFMFCVASSSASEQRNIDECFICGF